MYDRLHIVHSSCDIYVLIVSSKVLFVGTMADSGDGDQYFCFCNRCMGRCSFSGRQIRNHYAVYNDGYRVGLSQQIASPKSLKQRMYRPIVVDLQI